MDQTYLQDIEKVKAFILLHISKEGGKISANVLTRKIYWRFSKQDRDLAIDRLVNERMIVKAEMVSSKRGRNPTQLTITKNGRDTIKRLIEQGLIADADDSKAAN